MTSILNLFHQYNSCLLVVCKLSLRNIKIIIVSYLINVLSDQLHLLNQHPFFILFNFDSKKAFYSKSVLTALMQLS